MLMIDNLLVVGVWRSSAYINAFYNSFIYDEDRQTTTSVDLSIIDVDDPIVDDRQIWSA